MTDLSVNIDHVVLDDAAAEPRDSLRFGQRTETALQRLLEQRGMPPGLAGSDLREIVLSGADLPATAGDEQLAAGLADALYRALGGIG